MNALPAALREAAARLADISETPRLDAELLMAHALGCGRSEMLLRQAELAVPDAFAAMLERRVRHEPVAYITGRQAFWDLELAVTPDVLIPRADSETLIEVALAFFTPLPLAGGGLGRSVPRTDPKAEPGGSVSNADSPSPNPSRKREGNSGPARILDLGTGSGALLLAALSAFPEATGTGIDASERALAVAEGNAERLGFAKRSQWLHRSWRDAGWGDNLGRFELILCNPPYVEDSANLAPMVADYEPQSALFAGPDGLDDYRILLPQIPALLASGGTAIFEIGHEQANAVHDLASKAGLSTEMRRDLAGKPRALRFSLGIDGPNG